MANFYQFDTRWKNVRGGFALSLVLFAISMLALLVLTVPVYRLLSRLTVGWNSGGRGTGESVTAVNPFSVVFGAPTEVPSSGTRRVDSTVVE
jgi:cytochrome c oxidase assembly protein Cox11